MQRRKILVACLSLLLAGLALPSISVPPAHAFFSNITVTLSGIGVSGFTDPHTNTAVDGIAAGSTLTVNVVIFASNFQPSYQRNITAGFKGDWMTHYQNASNANPSATLPLQSGQQGTATISVTMPSPGGLTAHSWNVAIWDGPNNLPNAAACFTGSNGERSSTCDLIPNFDAGYTRPLAIYTSDQLSAAQANVQATTTVTSVSGAITLLLGGGFFGGSHSPPPGTTAAAGQIAQANTEMSLGGQSWNNGDYGGAKTHYQNALNDANAASGDLTTQGGGVDTASLVNLLLGGAGLAMVGIGGLLTGIGAFGYLRRKQKA